MSEREQSALAHRMYADYGYDPETTRRMHSPYVERFKGCKAVLDIGCGRGEFLELLAQAGIEARGVDLDGEQVADDQARGLPVVQGEARDYLAAHRGEFDGFFAGHVMEHLTVDEARDLLLSAYAALPAGGRMLMVVPNVASVGMHLDHYYRDFTHRAWAHPALLGFLCRDAGFSEVESGENAAAAYPHMGEAVQLYMTGEHELAVLLQEAEGAKDERLLRLTRAAHMIAQAGRSVLERLDRPFEAWVLASKTQEAEQTLEPGRTG